MATEPNLASLSKISDVAVSMVREFSKSLPVILALGVTALGILAWTPVADPHVRTALTALPLFCFVYYMGLLWVSYRPLRKQRYFLKRLGEDEKRVLRLFLQQDRRTMHMNVLYAPTASLIAKGLLSNATSTFPPIGAPIVIQSYTYAYLSDHPELIGMTKEDIGREDIDDSDCTWMSRP